MMNDNKISSLTQMWGLEREMIFKRSLNRGYCDV